MTGVDSSDDDVPDVDYSEQEDDYSDDDDDDDIDYIRPYCAVTVEPMLFLYCTAVFMYQPIYQLYLFSVVANDTSPYWKQDYCDPNMTYFNESDPDYLDDKWLTDEVTKWDTIITLTGSVPGLFTAVILGTMSDQLGRKINLVLSCVAGILQAGLGLLIVFLQLPVWSFIPGSIIAGISGGGGVFFGACYSYVVDISQSERETTIRIAILDTTIGLASVVGTVVAGVVLTTAGFPDGVRGPFVFLFAAYVVCMLYAIFILRETRPTDWKNVQLFSKGYFTAAVKLLRKKQVSLYGRVTDGWNKRLILFLLAGAFYFAQADGAVSFPVFLTSAPPFCWTPLQTGILQGALSACGLTSLFGILILQRCLSYPVMTQIGIVSCLLVLVLTAVSSLCPDYNLALYMTPVLGAFITMPQSLISAALSLMVGPNDQGSLFALIQFTQGAMTTVTTPFLNYIWATTSMGIMPGFVQLLSALLVGVASAMIGLVQYWDWRSPAGYQLVPAVENTEDSEGRINTDADDFLRGYNPAIV
uniref:Major facilitator superfamily (MFS) profile domain-containing protein n=1 Tax=Branchiostoma floridae TaxID=7739 RepID=C3YWC1_BRAFL|eukprot:XP_002599438.1 hypothetical protein BRAFLDRAFT_106581 [Branchiostoma floridae]